MKIIAFTGMPGSGKSEAVSIAQHLGIPVIRMGDMVWDEVKARGLPLDDAHVGRIADTMRTQHGKDIWAQRTLQKIKTYAPTQCLVIDGIRNAEEIQIFKKHLGADFQVIAVTAPTDLRMQRILHRKRIDDGTRSDFEERDKRELSWGLGQVIAAADLVIPNEGSLTDFHNQVTLVLSKL
jgi:dephospho-CoA kinase